MFHLVLHIFSGIVAYPSHREHTEYNGPAPQCIAVQYSTVQYSTVQYSTVQYSTVQYSTVQYSIVHYSTVQKLFGAIQ